jgi:hypothetical protein
LRSVEKVLTVITRESYEQDRATVTELTE